MGDCNHFVLRNCEWCEWAGIQSWWTHQCLFYYFLAFFLVYFPSGSAAHQCNTANWQFGMGRYIHGAQWHCNKNPVNVLLIFHWTCLSVGCGYCRDFHCDDFFFFWIGCYVFQKLFYQAWDKTLCELFLLLITHLIKVAKHFVHILTKQLNICDWHKTEWHTR